MNLSTHFSLTELTKSQTAVRLGIDNTPNDDEIESLKLVCTRILEPVRRHFGIAFSPSSGYRSGELCIAIGSKPTSQHAYGEAVDFEVPTVSNYEVACWVKQFCDFDQLILEHYEEGKPNSGWVHCSINPNGEGRKEVLTYNKSRGYSVGLV